MKITFDAHGIMLEGETMTEKDVIMGSQCRRDSGRLPDIRFRYGAAGRLHLSFGQERDKDMEQLVSVFLRLMELAAEEERREREQNAFTARVETALKDLGFKLPKRRCK